MTGPAFDRIVAALENAGRPVKLLGGGRARSSCPAHGGDNPTALSIMDTADRVNLRCFTKDCDGADVLDAIGLAIRDLYHKPKGDRLAVYDYGGGYKVTRYVGDRGDGKEFRQTAGWSGRPRPLYRRERIPEAVAAGKPVLLVEGEEDVHALEAAHPDVVAVTAPQGGANFAHADATPLAGAVVVAVVDRDPTGDRWSQAVATKLEGVAKSVRFVRAAVGKDLADHLAAGRALAELEDYSPPLEDTGRDAAAELLEREIGEEVRRLIIREEARKRLRASQEAERKPFDAGLLEDILNRPESPPDRVEGLIPWDAATLVSAQRKTGKTTFGVNLARSLITGDPFLNRFDVRRIDGRVAFLNYEVSALQLARWLDDHGVPPQRLFQVNLRGRANPLADPEHRAELAELLRQHETESLIVDPFGRAYTGQSQNDAGEVGRWLSDLSQFAREEVGALDLVLATHAGWEGERTRGSSALEDWPDVIVTMTRDAGSGERYLRAEGRDVELEEDRLSYDPDTRALSLTGFGSRKVAAQRERDSDTADLIIDLLSKVEHAGGLTGNALAELAGRKDSHFTRVRNALVEEGTLLKTSHSGQGGGNLYRIGRTYRTSREPTESGPSKPTEHPLKDVREVGRYVPAEKVPRQETPPDSPRCRLHPTNPIPGCWTCDQIADGRDPNRGNP